MFVDPVNGARALCEVLSKRVDFFGVAGPAMPAAAALGGLLRTGGLVLPLGYRDSYVVPVQREMERLLALAQAGRIQMSSVEIVTGGIVQHVPDWPLAAELRRFVAVISNLYCSFLDNARRAAARIPALAQPLPPLAAFQHDGSSGPITIASDLMAHYVGGSVGVVALPATFACHPILWTTLAHETGGHDVTHADAGLLDQLAGMLPGALAPFEAECRLPPGVLVRLWTHWLDEAAADVYAIMNAGPAFVENAVVLLAAMGGEAVPGLRAESRAVGAGLLDPHPADILRPHIGLGAIGALEGLSSRTGAMGRITALAEGFCRAEAITLVGGLPDGSQRRSALAAAAPREAMARAAEAVGRMIATAVLPALGGLSIQAIETWDDADERVVSTIREGLAARRSVAGLGDDAQVLAAASAAVMEDAGDYDTVSGLLNEALDLSFDTDPLWGSPAPDRMYLRDRA